MHFFEALLHSKLFKDRKDLGKNFLKKFIGKCVLKKNRKTICIFKPIKHIRFRMDILYIYMIKKWNHFNRKVLNT